MKRNSTLLQRAMHHTVHTVDIILVNTISLYISHLRSATYSDHYYKKPTAHMHILLLKPMKCKSLKCIQPIKWKKISFELDVNDLIEGTGIGHVLPYCQQDIWTSDDYAVILHTLYCIKLQWSPWIMWLLRFGCTDCAAMWLFTQGMNCLNSDYIIKWFEIKSIT